MISNVAGHQNRIKISPSILAQIMEQGCANFIVTIILCTSIGSSEVEIGKMEEGQHTL